MTEKMTETNLSYDGNLALKFCHMTDFLTEMTDFLTQMTDFLTQMTDFLTQMTDFLTQTTDFWARNPDFLNHLMTFFGPNRKVFESHDTCFGRK